MSEPVLSAAQIEGLVGEVRADAEKRGETVRALGIPSRVPWTGPRHLGQGAAPIAVVWCPSPLAVREALVEAEADAAPGGVTVVVTDRDERELGADALARLARQRLLRVDPWKLALDRFGARNLDPRLSRHAWMADALLEGSEVRRVASGLLDADTAWGVVLGTRFGLPAWALDPEGLLRLAQEPAGLARYRAAPPPERAAALEYVERTVGPLARAWLEPEPGGVGLDPVALGLVLGVVTRAGGDPRAEKARTRLEAYVDDAFATGPLATRWAQLAERVVTLGEGGRDASASLGAAEDLLVQLKAQELAGESRVLASGATRRLDALAKALERVLEGPGADGLAELETRLAAALDHLEIGRSPGRARALAMAGRLARWLAGGGEGTGGAIRELEAEARAYALEGSRVDLARATLWMGEVHGGLQAAAMKLVERARRDAEAAASRFASHLVEAQGRAAGSLIPIEEALARRVAPLARERPVLVVVLDGLSFPVMHALAADLDSKRWVPLTPAGATGPDMVLAAFPTVTRVCRASLLCGRLTEGDQAVEARGFAEHDALRRAGGTREPRLFHKADLVDAESGGGLAREVREALADPEQRVVGAVINAIDDQLDKGGQLDPDWRIDRIPLLAQLLSAAHQAGRVVVVTGDHGHVPEHGTRAVEVGASAEGDRYRVPGVKLKEGEVLLTGPRVLVGGRREVVVPASAGLRYGSKKSGYHGGATPQEALVPLVVLHSGFEPPEGWRELRWPTPAWWNPPEVAGAVPGGRAIDAPVGPGQGMLFTGSRPPRKGEARTVAPPPAAPVVAPAAAMAGEARPSPGSNALADRLLASKRYGAQAARNFRQRVADETVRAVVAFLLERGGRATLDAVGRGCDINNVRLGGTISSIQRTLNFDEVAVLVVDPASETVILDLELLKEQFGLT